ncbi:restriction endonuclease [Streptomyces melanogenes]|uniref:restriction endonuclease n=1 Tax=Streptomyces melanogenes TaxID=67326 RepID=UPI00167D5E69|nr:restriction endonuclease [Streptomyces melanogenes]
MPQRKRQTSKARRQRLLRRRTGTAAAVLAVSLFVFWQYMWLLIALVVATILSTGGLLLWRAHRREQEGDRTWREQNRRMALERSMTAIDAMGWQDFEAYVAELCRRDGCTKVLVVGGSGDLAADILGYLPDGRRLVVQVKHYAPHRKVPSGDMQKFVGMAFAEHHADVALFVTTCEYSGSARQLALKHHIVALNRDLFGSWNSGAPLSSLLGLGGTGAGLERRRRPRRA